MDRRQIDLPSRHEAAVSREHADRRIERHVSMITVRGKVCYSHRGLILSLTSRPAACLTEHEEGTSMIFPRKLFVAVLVYVRQLEQ